MDGNLNPRIEVKSISNSPFKFNIAFSITQLPPNQKFELWKFYPNGKSIGGQLFVSDENGNAFEPNGANEISVGLSSSDVLPNGNYIFGINIGQFNPPIESHFNDWHNSQNSKFHTLIDMSFDKETILTLNEIGKVPWGTDAATSGSLWYKGVSIEHESIWPSGGKWFVGRKIHLINNNEHLKDVETDGLSRFLVNFKVANRPERGCSLQAHYDGDDKYFDSCDSCIINYEVVRHKTTLTIEIDNLKLNPLDRNEPTSQIDLEADQEFRIKGRLNDTDFAVGIEGKRINIETNLPFPIALITTQNDGSFLMDNLKTPLIPGSYYVKAVFGGDDLYKETRSNSREFQTISKVKKVGVKFAEKQHIREPSKKYDVFISHASEDKEGIARPLAAKLKAMNVKVWYDEFTLTIGDSLTESIDKGIRDSRYGVVILSKNFFSKNWPKHELRGLTSKMMMSGRKVILPVWHNINFEEVYQYSPTLADIVAISSQKGVDYIAHEILAELFGRGARVRYESRSELPSFGIMMSLARSTIDMSGLDFRIVVHQFMNIITENLYRGIRITFLLLDPNSSVVEIQSERVFAGEDLKPSIEKSLKLLYQVKMGLPTEIRDRLVIRTYDSIESESIILIDKEHIDQDNAWIKVEYRHGVSDSNSRPSDSTFKTNDEEFFNEYLNKFNTLLDNARVV